MSLGYLLQAVELAMFLVTLLRLWLDPHRVLFVLRGAVGLGSTVQALVLRGAWVTLSCLVIAAYSLPLTLFNLAAFIKAYEDRSCDCLVCRPDLYEEVHDGAVDDEEV